MTATEVIDLEIFATTIPQFILNRSHILNVKLTPVYQRNILYLFLGMYATDSMNFKFKMGENVLIMQLIQFSKRELEINNNSNDIFEQNISERNATVATHIGDFFGSDDLEPNCFQPTEYGTFLISNFTQ